MFHYVCDITAAVVWHQEATGATFTSKVFCGLKMSNYKDLG
jgi:hypothetical protein